MEPYNDAIVNAKNFPKSNLSLTNQVKRNKNFKYEELCMDIISTVGINQFDDRS